MKILFIDNIFQMMEKVCVYFYMAFWVCIFQMGLIIPSLYYGFLDEDATCQQGTRGGLNLSDWNKGFGFEKIAVNMIMLIFMPLCAMYKLMFVIPGVTIVLDTIFNVAWVIWGIVILATRENRNCVAEEKGIAIIGIIDIVLSSLWFLHLKSFVVVVTEFEN